MHEKFKEHLQTYTIDSINVEPLKRQLQYTWENLTEQSTSEKKVISLKLNEVDQDFYNMKKQYAIGKLIEGIYLEFSAELSAAKKKLLEELQKLNDRLSNPTELIHDTCYMAANLPSVWESWNYHEKQNFQNVLFPEGLLYDAKKEQYRTEKINCVFGYVAHCSQELLKIKSRFPLKLSEKNGLVPPMGMKLNIY